MWKRPNINITIEIKPTYDLNLIFRDMWVSAHPEVAKYNLFRNTQYYTQ